MVTTRWRPARFDFLQNAAWRRARPSYLWRGLICIRFKADWDRAIADYDEALKLNPKSVGAYAGRTAANLRKATSIAHCRT
jgi:hypothetical protein